MWRIIRGVFLGDHRDACDRELLLGLGITHVLNCAREIPCYYPTDFKYLHLRLRDPDPAFIDRIPRLCKFIRIARRRGNVLVHCRAGLSRSPSAILAFLCSRGKSFEEAIEFLQRRVGESNAEFVEPDESFLEQIEAFFEPE